MPIFIYNSLSRKKEELIPLKPKEIKMYVCGPTVYDQPHIGHARSAYIFDVIRRYLVYKDYKVTFVRNVTDVDDKIINKAKEELPGEDLNTSFKKVADKYLSAYHDALNNLGIEENGIVEPKASDYIPKMIKFIQDLIGRDTAYISEGDVYFDIKKARDYGKLSNQAIEKMESGARVSLGEKKKDPLDFALWKSAKAGEPAWDSPWGKGRPGWHIECSVMSSDILGDEFDIHGGGLDLIFPHHENEIAQSEGAGKKFARYWIHHGLLTINGQKMSKSLGNFITINDVLSKYPVDALKILYLQTHYSNPMDFTERKLDDAYKATQRFEMLFHNTQKARKSCISGIRKAADFIEKNKNNFIEAMDDNFNTPDALASLFGLVSDTNKFIDSGAGSDEYVQIINEAEGVIRDLGKNVFGFVFENNHEVTEIGQDEIEARIIDRTNAKQAKDYVLADKIRKNLEGQGIILEDTKDGKTTWRKKL
ncbi:MAG: cysteine--tRNA ligase [Candidatus Omnitrophota bacterium]|jgi:cysteinyl-tRNA synthetase